jgi:hypothetical protein
MYPRKVEKEQQVKMRKRGSWMAEGSKRERAGRLFLSHVEPESSAGMESEAAARATKPMQRMAQGKPTVFVRRSNIII